MTLDFQVPTAYAYTVPRYIIYIIYSGDVSKLSQKGGYSMVFNAMFLMLMYGSPSTHELTP